jgi:hypothetical protein
VLVRRGGHVDQQPGVSPAQLHLGVARQPPAGCNRPRRSGASQAGDPRPVPGISRPAPRCRGSSSHCAARTMAPCEAGGPVSSGRFPRHARRPGAARRAGRIAGSGPTHLRPDGDHEALRPLVRFDPLTHPVAITAHCIIGDQIRVPAAWCDMAGCGAAFADPAALGEADNRARAVVAGWAEDAVGTLACPVCQQHDHAAAARRASPGEPGITGDRQAADATTRPAGGLSQSVPPAVWAPPAAGPRRHHRATHWPRLPRRAGRTTVTADPPALGRRSAATARSARTRTGSRS